jgi:secondary thiamine-phosphate synthase enzyme
VIKLSIQTTKKREVVDITDLVEAELQKQEKKSGVVHLFVTHTTAALTTADLDPDTDQDYLDAFDKLIPNIKFNHPHDPSHMPDHILSSIIGTSLGIPYENQKLVLGTWQRVVLLEFDGPRSRELVISFL